MTGANDGLTHDGFDGDAAAYALGALDPAEAEAFERHLEQCVVCAEELVAFRDVADALAESAPQYAAPAGLRRRVLGSVRSEPHPHSAPVRRRFWESGPTGSPPRRGVMPLAIAVAAVLAAAVLVMSTLVSGGSGRARVISASVIHARGTAEVRLRSGRAELTVRGFSPPPAGLIYEVWLKRPGRPPAPTRVLFSVTNQGAGDIGVPAALNGVNELLVTPEPDGGSEVPTHPPVIVARLS
jgi:anti-sigma-K factor RskA